MSSIPWDVETYSDVDLKTYGAFNYARHPSTDLIFLCFAIDDGPIEVWRRGDPVPAPFANPTEHLFISDNWTFEGLILEHVLIPRYGFKPIPIENQDCAQRKALASAFPAELGLRCEALGLPRRKDKAARQAMLRVTCPQKRKRKKPEDPAVRERDLALLLERCKSDAAMTRACYNHPRLRPLPPEERRVLLADAMINARGICVNTPFLEAADALAKEELVKINAHVNVLPGGTVNTINQTELIRKLVNEHGHQMTTLGKRSVAAVLARQPDPFTREILTLRQRGAFASTLKFPKLLKHASHDDHRIRHALRYHGAGPGRWTSPGAQLQNLPRNDLELPASLLNAITAGNRAELERYGDLLKVLSQLSRASLCAAPGCELICVDLSTIESRGTAWFAGEDWKLSNFRRYDETGNKNLDLYRILAHLILRKNCPVEDIRASERQLGKYSELAFNFGGATGAWKKIVGNDGRADSEILAIVQAWRSKHPATRMFWRRLLTATRTAIHYGRPVEVNPPPLPPVTASFDGYALMLELPNHRVINYSGAHPVPNEKFEDAPLDIEFFDNEKGKWAAKRAWHGLLVENVVQGMARDLLAAAITRAEARGWKVVHHNHDELIIEAPIGAISAQDALALLLDPPAWAVGLPLGGKVRVGPLFLEAPATGEPSSAQATVDYVESDVGDTEDADEDIPSDDIVLTCLDEMRTETSPQVEVAVSAESPVTDANSLPWEGVTSFTAPLKMRASAATASPVTPVTCKASIAKKFIVRFTKTRRRVANSMLMDTITVSVAERTAGSTRTWTSLMLCSRAWRKRKIPRTRSSAGSSCGLRRSRSPSRWLRATSLIPAGSTSPCSPLMSTRCCGFTRIVHSVTMVPATRACSRCSATLRATRPPVSTASA